MPQEAPVGTLFSSLRRRGAQEAGFTGASAGRLGKRPHLPRLGPLLQSAQPQLELGPGQGRERAEQQRDIPGPRPESRRDRLRSALLGARTWPCPKSCQWLPPWLLLGLQHAQGHASQLSTVLGPKLSFPPVLPFPRPTCPPMSGACGPHVFQTSPPPAHQLPWAMATALLLPPRLCATRLPFTIQPPTSQAGSELCSALHFPVP